MNSAAELLAWTGRARAWLGDQLAERPAPSTLRWGVGSDSVALFKNLSPEQERAHVDVLRAWQRSKQDAGFGSITWPQSYGGAALGAEYERGFLAAEQEFQAPEGHEAVTISLDLVGPTILACGTGEQKDRYLRPLRRADEHWCQLFSEPGAGSDLASVATKAERDGDGWRVTGQKVWTSGAQFADYGYILTRTDPQALRHSGLTAFLIDMHSPGVEVRPLRQMSGGSSFNEVFLDGVWGADTDRLGTVGGGWQVAITTLGFERVVGSRLTGGGPNFYDLLVLTARHQGRASDLLVRQGLAAVWADQQIRWLIMRRAETARQDGGVPGAEGSIGKLAMTEGLHRIADVAALILGPRLAADTGEWGTFSWSEFICGVPGSRVAGGTDEVQRNIIAERVLGLPREPR